MRGAKAGWSHELLGFVVQRHFRAPGLNTSAGIAAATAAARYAAAAAARYASGAACGAARASARHFAACDPSSAAASAAAC